MTPEGLVKQQIRELLDYLGAYYRMPVPTGRGPKLLDFYVCARGLRGRFVAIEAKAPGEEATPLQKIEIGKIRDAGGIAFEADSVLAVVHEFEKYTDAYIVPRAMLDKWRNQNERAARRRASDKDLSRQAARARRL